MLKLLEIATSSIESLDASLSTSLSWYVLTGREKARSSFSEQSNIKTPANPWLPQYGILSVAGVSSETRSNSNGPLRKVII